MAIPTQDEIVVRHEAQKADDMFGFAADVLLAHLDYQHVRPYLRPDTTETEWSPKPLEESALRDELVDYLEFAFGKATDHRGLSAERNVAKLIEYAWLLGRQDVIDEMAAAPYENYGAPKLRVIAEAFGVPIPHDDGLRAMMRGEPCRPGCEDGCGT